MATMNPKHNRKWWRWILRCNSRCKFTQLDENVKHVLIIFFVTAIFLPLICSYQRHSVFFVKPKNVDKERENMKRLSEQRYNASLQYIKSFSREKYSFGNQGDSTAWADIGITIITVSRNRHYFDKYEPKYLTQVFGRLLHLLKDPSLRKRYAVFICNVDRDPGSYKEVSSLSGLVPIFQRFRTPVARTSNIFDKEKKDYLYCLNETIARGVQYTFLVEDDAFADEQLFPVLENVIDRQIEHRAAVVKHFFKAPKPTYVKFYHPPRLLGYYSYEVERIPELIGISVFFGSFLSFFYCKLQPRVSAHHRKVWVLFCVYVCLVAMAIGRQNLLELRRVSKHLFQVTPAPSCCTPAMLFPSEQGKRLISYMSEVKCRSKYAKDALLEDVKRKHGLVGLMVQPNLFTHIGLYSSLRSKILDPFIV